MNRQLPPSFTVSFVGFFVITMLSYTTTETVVENSLSWPSESVSVALTVTFCFPVLVNFFGV